MIVFERNNVVVKGEGLPPLMFAHGFGCDQNMWRYVVPNFEKTHKIILFDHVGAGKSDLNAFDANKYQSLDGYADDIIEIIQEANLGKVVFIGHSVSAMMGIIAATKSPDLFQSLILVAPSPCFLKDDDYDGGFSKTEINQLLEALDQNHMGWSQSIAPVIMGNQDKPELTEELTESFCRTDPTIARHFARTTFLSDCRDRLAGTDLPVLILQCSDDLLAPVEVGQYLQKTISNSTLMILDATGHCPNLSAPEETTAAIKKFI